MTMPEVITRLTDAAAQSPTIAVFMLAGCLLLFAGLTVFKGVQFVICAMLGGLVGLAIREVSGRQEMIYVAAVLALVFGVIGVWKYKTALYIAGSLCTFCAVSLWFLKRAYSMVRQGVAAIPDADTLLKLWVEQLKEKGDLAAATRSVIGEQTAQILEELKSAIQVLERGLLIAFLAGIVVGVLALLLGDYIIILFTSVAGAVLLISMADRVYDLEAAVYNTVLLVMALFGIVFQSVHKWNHKNVKKDRRHRSEKRTRRA